MNTKKHILLLLSTLLIGGFTAVNITAYASGGGGSGSTTSSTSPCEIDPTSCECTDSCDDPTSGANTSNSVTTTTTTTTGKKKPKPKTTTAGTIVIIEPPLTTSGTIFIDPEIVLCLPKKFTKMPDFGNSNYKTGLCSGGDFVPMGSYKETINNVIVGYFEGICISGTTVATCHYKIDTVSCLNDTLICPDGTKLFRSGDKCSFPSCPANPKCPTSPLFCPDGTKLFRSGDKCSFPSCPANPACNNDTFTCNDGTVVYRSGTECAFTCPGDVTCTDKITCPDGSEMSQVKENGVCVNPACPPIDIVGYSISGKITADETNLEGITVQVFDLFGNIIKSTTTASDGAYYVEGLKIGSYKIKPVSTSDYIFILPTDGPSSVVKIEKSNVRDRNFNAAYLKKITDTKTKDGIIDIASKEGLTSGTNDSSLTSWLQSLNENKDSNDNTSGTNTNNNGNNSGDTSTTAGLSNTGDNLINSNQLTSNSLISLLQNGFTLEDKSYSPVTLSLINKKANPNAICGDGLVVEGETCDDGRNNGKNGFCSADCLYIGEIRVRNDLGSNVFGDEGNNTENYKRETFGNVTKKLSEWSQAGASSLKNFSVLGSDIIKSGLHISEEAQKWTKRTIASHTSPHTRKIMKEVAAVTVETAKYSVIGVASILGVAAVSLNIMVFKTQWKTYTIQDGETFDTLGSKFNMTERAIRRKNGLGKKTLRPGMKLKVRNRAFIEKDYLDQLKLVLTDSLKTRNHGHMAEKIEKMFAKK